MAHTTIDVFDRYGLTGKLIFENALQRLLSGKATVDEAMDYIMEFARGGWHLVVDENQASLVRELEKLRYLVRAVPLGMSDDDIRKKYAQRGVFITSNDRDFTLDEVPDQFEDGMILVPSSADSRRLAKAVEALLMTWQEVHGGPVKHRITRDDL